MKKENLSRGCPNPGSRFRSREGLEPGTSCVLGMRDNRLHYLDCSVEREEDLPLSIQLEVGLKGEGVMMEKFVAALQKVDLATCKALIAQGLDVHEVVSEVVSLIPILTARINEQLCIGQPEWDHLSSPSFSWKRGPT